MSGYQETKHRLTLALLILMFATAAPWGCLFAQDQELEEVVVEFEVKQLIRHDIFVQYDYESIYLPLIEILDMLDVYVSPNFRQLRFSGHYLSDDDKFEIDFQRQRAVVSRQQYSLSSSDYVIGAKEAYLKLELFNQLFGLDMKFNFGNLQVRMSLNEDFPSYKKLKRHQSHQKLAREAEGLRDVRRLPRAAPYFGAGILDWAVSASPVGGGGQYFDFTMGSMFLRGDLTVSGGGNSDAGLETGDMTYKWHYYNEDSRLFSQVDAGDVFTSGLFARQFRGVSVTNRPQIPRKFFQTVEVSGFLGEGWEVELYVNNRLTDFLYTGPSGRYGFSVDIMYGTSDVLLKMYGPNGEIKTERTYVDVPYSLVPHRTFEYTVTAGSTEHSKLGSQSITQASGFYGVTERLTVGISSDVPLETKDGAKPILAAEATAQIVDNLTGNASLSPGYASGLSLNYSDPEVMSGFADFTKYSSDSYLNTSGQEYRLTFSASAPLKLGKRRYPVRYSLSMNKYPLFNSINMNYGVNGSLFGVPVSYLGRTKMMKYINRTVKEISSEILASPLILKRFRPQLKAIWDHSNNRFESYGIQLNQRILRSGQLSVSLERNETTKTNQIKATFRLFSGFADFTTRMTSTAGYTSVSQTQRGSVRYDQEGGRLLFDRRSGAGSGAAVVQPFLDYNYNGSLDENEQLLPGLRAKFRGGRQRLTGDQYYFYDGLRAYDRYLIQIDEFSLDDPTLKPTHEHYEVACNPNVVTAIAVPLIVGSEVSGQVMRQIDSVTTGLGGVRLMLLNLSNESVLELTSFSGGEFFYLGLVPGSYRAYIDPDQLARQGYRAEPEAIEFVVKPVAGGTSIENINFLIKPIQ